MLFEFLNYFSIFNTFVRKVPEIECVKSIRIRSFSGPNFPAFELNTERYGLSFRIQQECGKISTRKTSNTDTFHGVILVILQWLMLPFLLKTGLRFTGCLIVLYYFSEKLLCRKSVKKRRWNKGMQQGILPSIKYCIFSKNNVSSSLWCIERLLCILHKSNEPTQV